MPTDAQPIRLLSTLAVFGALKELIPAFEKASGHSVNPDYSPTVGLMPRLRGGETGDAVIITDEAMTQLGNEGLILPETRVPMAISYVGVGVRAGAPKPDISTPEALRATLLAAKSVAYSRIGASGIFFADLIQRMGIADAVNARAHIIPTGFTGEPVARGEADLAIQQVSELKAIPGVEVVGKLPREYESVTSFSAALMSKVANREPAHALLRFISAPVAADALIRSGVEPPAKR